MQHTIPIEQLRPRIGPQIEAMTKAVESCVHCGFCLPVCPTYRVLGEEMDSPRGRIILMKEVLEGSLGVEEASPFIDRCLGCLACVTTCPSGVHYDALVTPYKAFARKQGKPKAGVRLRHNLVRGTLPYPGRFRVAARMGKLAAPVTGLLPDELQGMLDMLPEKLPAGRPLPELAPAEGKRRARVALLAGCVQQALDPEINWATLRVLTRNGVEVVIPRQQGCCGAILIHMGDKDKPLSMARANLAAFPKDVDAVVTNAAGCGSGMKEYESFFDGEPDQAAAGDFARRVKDTSEFLAELGIITPAGLAEPTRAAYHDACHLAHAQRITEAPRKLLRQIPNLTLVETPESDLCCGSAGTYNLEQPEIARKLGKRKAENLLSTGSQMVVTGNIGCIIQIQKHLYEQGQPLAVYHIMQLLDRAYQ